MGDENDPKRLTRRELLEVVAVGAAIAAIPGCGDGTGTSDGGVAPGTDAQRADAPTEPVDSGGGGVDGGMVEDVPPPESVAESTMFAMAVASGDVTTSSAILWTHHAGAAPLELVVWRMDGDTYAATVFVGAAPLTDGYVHVDVGVLAPQTRYRFVFFEAGRGARSPIGRFRTPAAADVMEPLRIGAVSCVSNTQEIPTLGHAGARTDLDVFLFLGDSTYNDGARTLDAYRAKWRSNLERPEYRALRASTSGLFTWDDHEFDNDWDPEDFPPAAMAKQAFFEHQPARRIAGAPDRIWKSMRWGRTAEIFVLDCRSERIPSGRTTPGATYISRAQMDWLKGAVVASDAVFKIIMNSVPISDMPGIWDAAPRDRWEGYAAQRTEILEHLDAAALTGLLWVAGDFHCWSGGRIGATDTAVGGRQHEVLVGPGAQSGNLLASTLNPPQFDHAGTDKNYVVLELDPAAISVRVYWTAGDGRVIRTIEYDLG